LGYELNGGSDNVDMDGFNCVRDYTDKVFKSFERLLTNDYLIKKSTKGLLQPLTLDRFKYAYSIRGQAIFLQ